MNAKEIKVGTKLELEVINNLGSKISKTYTSQFAKIKNSIEVIIAAPINKIRDPFVLIGAKIKVTFFHESFGLVFFLGTISYIEDVENLMMVHTRIDDDFKEIQRRRYFRIDKYLRAEYRVINEADIIDENNSDAVQYRKALLKNISYRGACSVIDENIPNKAIIDLIIWLTDETKIKMRSRIIRSTEIESSGIKKYKLNLCLIDMDQDDKDNLKKFITRSLI
ncbi:flagellar brake protein [Acetobacterium sp.]|uniref:flagellar brake protein n=1 Tax=Acetobacterium sp. TaxID=1872094 RepID=UPI002F427645